MVKRLKSFERNNIKKHTYSDMKKVIGYLVGTHARDKDWC